jgi:hypothetical protein
MAEKKQDIRKQIKILGRKLHIKVTVTPSSTVAQVWHGANASTIGDLEQILYYLHGVHVERCGFSPDNPYHNT